MIKGTTGGCQRYGSSVKFLTALNTGTQKVAPVHVKKKRLNAIFSPLKFSYYQPARATFFATKPAMVINECIAHAEDETEKAISSRENEKIVHKLG